MGLPQVPVIMLPLRASDRNAFAIADNRTSQIAEWDFEELGEVLQDLMKMDDGAWRDLAFPKTS